MFFKKKSKPIPPVYSFRVYLHRHEISVINGEKQPDYILDIVAESVEAAIEQAKWTIVKNGWWGLNYDKNKAYNSLEALKAFRI